MAEIPIERKPARNWLPLILAALALLILLGYCATRNRNATGTTASGDSASTRNVLTDSGRNTGAGVAGAGAGSSASAAAGTAGAAAGNGAAGATSGGANGAVDQFVQFTQQHDTTGETEGQHQYTAEGTRRLAAALEALGGSGSNISMYADSMRSSVDRLQRSSAKDMHSDDAKAAFSAAVSAMAQIDKTKGTTRDVAPLRAIYNQLNSKQPLMPQRATVERFFKAAADALQTMRS